MRSPTRMFSPLFGHSPHSARDPEREVDQKSEQDPEREVPREQEPERTPEQESESEPEPHSEPEQESKQDPDPDPAAERESDRQPEQEPEQESEEESEEDPGPAPERESDRQSEQEPERQSEHEPEQEPERQSEQERAGRRGGHGRLGRVPLTTKLVAGLLVGATLLVVADRCAAMYAEKRAEQTLRDKLGLEAAPDVHIHGFPFLTQLLGKRLDGVDVTVPDAPAGRVTLAEVRAEATDIRLDGDLPLPVDGARAARVNGHVLLAFDDLDRELGAPAQVRFRALDRQSVRADGELPVAGRVVRIHAVAHIRRDGDRGVTTSVSGMRLDVPGIATYRPGRPARLRLHPQAAEKISHDKSKARALLAVPSVARQLGVAPEDTGPAMRDDERLSRITERPGFKEKLMRANLVDLVADRPEALERVGVDPVLARALVRLRAQDLSERVAFSFQLPKQVKGLRLRNITVERDGIRADLTGSGLAVGTARRADS
ncbi:LmeA family phospholipid-binding protein [Streptomyces sparsogenes]|uniref:LmeA family phospholipid-binding protein n=1 Tax=Streptomyces sparsogenes TaxID=67365 RepID=UPI00384AA693